MSTRPDGSLQVFTFLTPEDVRRTGGIPNRAIVGLVQPEALEGGRFTPETFRPNPAFADFVHQVIAERGPALPGVRAEAQRVGDGWVYIVDARTPSGATRIPPEDVLGAFQAKAGSPVADSYWRNPAHRLVSENGLFRLPGELHLCLLDALRALPLDPTGPGPAPAEPRA